MITIAHAARALAGALLVLSFVGIARSAEPADLAGTWTAYPQVREQTGELVIYIEPGENASLNAGLELPQIESRRIALGEVPRGISVCGSRDPPFAPPLILSLLLHERRAA